MIRSSQRGFMKRKSCLTNLIAFYDETRGWIVKGRAVDVVYFSKVFDIVFHDIVKDKVRKCRLDEWMMRWIKN